MTSASIARKGLATRAVHAGVSPAHHLGAASPPIYQTTTFVATDTADLEAINRGEKRGFVYTRQRNPTIMAAEERLAALEEAESVVLFGSGMAAIEAAVSSVTRAGDEIISIADIYGGTYRFFSDILPARGVTVNWCDSLDASAIERLITPRTKAIYVESPTNPLVQIVDLAAVAVVAKEKGVALLVDSTLGGPMNQRPLQLGADLVIHSGSKYLNGHGDLIVGAVAGLRKMTRPVRQLQQSVGAIIDPFGAWLFLRGMATYPLRMAQHNATGLAVATYLADHAHVSSVHYPGLATHPHHALAQRQMSGFGGLLSFTVAGDGAAARRVVDGCRLCGIGPSIGGVESLISQPANTSHYSMPESKRMELGITDNLIRLSVGIETTQDVIDDLKQALENV
jgi:cystathionine beta-lyase/cystathionine gamma-synthase